jgi:hypothetical protein
MSRWQPDKPIIYEHADGVTYGRQLGSTQRHVVGMTLEAQRRREGIQENQLWYEIRESAKTNPALQDALERVKVIYYLSRP